MMTATWLMMMPSSQTYAQQTTSQLNLDQPGHAVSRMLYGLMTEEINHSYDGGLYAELVRNRTFQDSPKIPEGWSLVQDSGAVATMELSHQNPLDAAVTVCLKLSVKKPGTRVGIADSGYWGIPVMPGTTYQGSLYVKASTSGASLNISIENPDGGTRYASTQVTGLQEGWEKYAFPSDLQRKT